MKRMKNMKYKMMLAAGMMWVFLIFLYFNVSTVYAAPLADGTYRIVAMHSGKVIDAHGLGTDNGTQLVQWPYLGGNNQKWVVSDIGNNEYSIIGLQSNKSIDISDWGTADGTKVQLWDYLEGTNQKFFITTVDGEFYRITPTHAPNSCLDVSSASSADGAEIHLWSYQGGANQQWSFIETTDNGEGDGGSGCGNTNVPRSGSYSIDIEGTRRTYVIDVPSNYNPNKAHKLIFAWHPNGGNAWDIANHGFYDIKPLAGDSTIFVAGEGIDAGWANTGDRDIKFASAMIDRIDSQYCIDKDRIFSTGWSYGGMFSFALGCGLGDKIRAIAPMSGALWGSGCASGDQPVAAWINHGIYDSLVPLQAGKDGRDEFLRRNHCGTNTVPTDPSPCVSYQGCDPGYPVVWCEWPGGHGTPSYQGTAIWSFFSQF
jgi:poly(3-hydroxybutyrate) depolymerase